MQSLKGLSLALAARGLRTTTSVLLLAALLICIPIASAGASAPRTGDLLFSQNFESQVAGVDWVDGSSHGRLTAVFDGYGTTNVSQAGSKVLTLQPKTALSVPTTHAGLVVTQQTFKAIDLRLAERTVRQLRSPVPNPWETAWVMWNYTDNTHFYYLALKPNGWELGKGDPAYAGAQRFLASGSNHTFPVGAWNAIRVRQVGATTTVWANGTRLVSFTDRERPYLGGAAGFYCEDSKAQFDDIVIRQP
jgi:hypothetical protein